MKRCWQIKNEAEAATAEMLIYGEISDETWLGDEVTPQQFASDLKQLNGKDLTVRVNSPGGDVFAAQSIYNQLMDYTGNVTMHIDGLCASAATIITCAADKVIMPDNAIFMIHNPQSALFGCYDSDNLQQIAGQLDTVKQTIVNVYNKRCNAVLPENKIKKMMDNETWMSAQEAKDNGFIDEIDTKNKVKNSLKDGVLIVNSISCNLKSFKNTAELEQILQKNEQKGAKIMPNESKNQDNDFFTKLKNLLGINEDPANKVPSADDPVNIERQRMTDLDAMNEVGNSAINKIIDTAKKNGATPESIKPYIDAVKTAAVDKQNSAAQNNQKTIDAITNLVKDNLGSGAAGVQPNTAGQVTDEQKQFAEKQKQARDVSDIINNMRGQK